MSAPLLPVAEARARILAAVTPLPAETVPLRLALGRILAEPLTARRTQPPCAVSAMDGYAVRADDLRTLPADLAVVETIAAGQQPGRTLGPGEAARIFTGAALPAGADMVVIQENTSPRDGRVLVTAGAVSPGLHVRAAGGDFRAGEVLLAPGRRLGPRDIALAAAMDASSVAVTRKARVAVLATGDELVRPGAPRGATQIVAASLDGLLAQIEAWGGEPYDLGLAPDRLETIAAALGAADADMAVTLGGASAGEHDLVRQALSAAGVALDFWRIAMRPGKPMMFGRSGSRLYLGLPGNPVSALVCALLFLKPALGRMHGADESPLRLRRAAMSVAMGPNDAREDYVRASLDPDGRVMPFPVQDSGQLRPLAHASVLLVRPAHAPALAPGDAVDVIELSAD